MSRFSRVGDDGEDRYVQTFVVGCAEFGAGRHAHRVGAKPSQ
jgi:hypothetical protein